MTFGAACLLILHHLFQGHWHFTSNTNVSIVQWDFCLFYLLFSYNPLAISQSKYQKHQIKRCKNVPVCSSIHDICCTTPFLLAWWWELQEELYESWNVACFEERDFKTSLKLASPPPFWAHRASCLCSLLNSSLCCIIFFWDNGISLQIQMYKLYSEIFVFSIYLFLIILLQFLNLHYDQNTKLFIARVCTVPVCSSNHDICCTTPFLLAWWRELQEEFYELWNVACFEERDF